MIKSVREMKKVKKIKYIRPECVIRALDYMKNVVEDKRKKKKSWIDRYFTVSFLFWTGVRSSEFLLIRRKDVELSKLVVDVPTLKQRMKEIPYFPIGIAHVPEDTRAYWEKYLADRKLDDRISPYRSRSGVKAAVNNFFKAYGIENVWPHMLRHSIAIYLVNRGVRFNTLQQFLRHTDPKNTAIYYSISASDMNRELERVNLSYI